MRAHFCSIDGLALLGGVLRGVVFGGAGVQALLSGVYAGVFVFLEEHHKENHEVVYCRGTVFVLFNKSLLSPV